MKHILTLILTFYSYVLLAQDDLLFFDKLDAFLEKNMTDGQLNYQAIKEKPNDLNELYDMVARMNPEGKSPEFEKAFHINAYNILVVKQVTVFYPISSPFDVAGFFDNIRHDVCKDEVTLDQLEKEYMLPKYQDPRLHFALVCAARGCPPLLSKAYRPETLDEQLELKAKEMLNDNSFVLVGSKSVKVSKIFDWYRDEFVADSKSILSYINKYRVNKIPTTTPIIFNDYDWTLNDFNN